MTDVTKFNDLYEQCATWRKFLVGRWVSFPDIAAEIDAAMWEHFVAGVTTERDLFRAVTVSVRRYVRGEARVTKVKAKVAAISKSVCHDDVEAVVDRLVARELLAAVEIPARAVPWLNRRIGASADPVDVVDSVYARRWAQRTRKVLAHA